MRPANASARTKQKHWEIQKTINISTILGEKRYPEGPQRDQYFQEHKKPPPPVEQETLFDPSVTNTSKD
jgi:hypothetical protein